MAGGAGTRPYRGRFAPSPTGALHFGSLITAVASYLDARAADGQWLVRIEDLDPPREVPGAAAGILRTLDAFGFCWDGSVRYQSQRLAAYQEIIDGLLGAGLAYPCACSRREIAAIGKPGIEGPVYPGRCRPGLARRKGRAVRLITDNHEISVEDRVQGRHGQRLESEIGDFVLRRADGYFAYQLAVVADDADQGITEIVRGCDLLHSTARQLHLQRALGYDPPRYAHLPLALDAQGRKLSKQDGAHPVDPRHPLPALRLALEFLNQPRAPDEVGSVPELWDWALGHWDLARVPRLQGINLSGQAPGDRPGPPRP